MSIYLPNIFFNKYPKIIFSFPGKLFLKIICVSPKQTPPNNFWVGIVYTRFCFYFNWTPTSVRWDWFPTIISLIPTFQNKLMINLYDLFLFYQIIHLLLIFLLQHPFLKNENSHFPLKHHNLEKKLSF